MADQRKAILVRISPELADALQRWARDELRSVSAQVEYLLREAVRKRSGRPVDSDAAGRQADSGAQQSADDTDGDVAAR
jgi:hypothetical protein